MKPKTAALLVLIGILTLTPFFFVQNSQNQQILASDFQFLGFSFSVVKGLVFCVILAAVAPSIYFSLKYSKLLKHAKGLEKNIERETRSIAKDSEALDLFHHGRFSAALAHLENPTETPEMVLKAKILIALDRPDEAIPLLKAGFFDHAHVQSGYILATTLMEQGESPLDVLKRLTQSKDGKNAFELLLDYYQKHGMWSECLETADQMTRLDFGVDEKQRIAFRFEEISDQLESTPKKIIDGYQQLLKKAPDFVPAHLALGEHFMNSKEEEKAFRVYEQAFARTGHPVFLDRLEAYYLQIDHPEGAIQVYRELMIKTGGPLIKFQLAKLYFKLEMMDECLEILEPLSHTLHHMPGFLYYLSEVKARRDRPEEAVEDLRKLVHSRGITRNDLICTNCNESYAAWRARCQTCKQWNTITSEASLVTVEKIPQNPITY